MSMQHKGYICENGKTQGKLKISLALVLKGRVESFGYIHTLVLPRVSRDDTN